MKTRSQVLSATALLAPGLAVYLFDRPADRIYFVPDWWQTGADNAPFFGPLGAGLPSFVHVLCFTLITAAILAPCRFRIMSICLSWFVIDSLFELAQHDTVAVRIAEFVPAWFQNFILLENTRAYLLAGTFDPLDMLSIAAGSLVAYVMLHIFNSKEYRHDN